MTPIERAIRLKDKYTKDYIRFVIKGFLNQEMTNEQKQYWQQVAIELGKLYKQQ